MATLRVEITGQFNSDAACSSDSRPLLIQRESAPVVAAGIRDWNAFCDAIDRVLIPATRFKNQLKFMHIFFFAFIGLYVFCINILPRTLPGFDYGLLKYAGLVVFPVVLGFIFVNCKAMRSFYASMDAVGEVCERLSTRGVSYRLGKEHWGGCAKPHVKRYFINVEVTDEEEPAVVAAIIDEPVAVAVGQQNHDNDSFASEYFFKQEAAATPANTLADMLK